MVREVSSTEMSDSSSEESFSSSSFFSSSSESDYEIANRHRKFYESSSDGGRDRCQCSYDYRGERDEIYCPRCRREVIEEFDDDDEDWFVQEQTTSKPISFQMKHQIVALESKNSEIDSLPSTNEDKVLKNDDQMEYVRPCQIVKADLANLTGSGLVTDEDYEGGLDDDKQKPKKRRKCLTKTKNTLRRRIARISFP